MRKQLFFLPTQLRTVGCFHFITVNIFRSDEEDSETSDYMSEEEDDDHETEENDDDYETEENDFWTDEDDDEENHPPGEEEDHPPEEEEDHPPEEEEGNQNEEYSDATSMSVENNQISSVAVLKQFWSTLTKEIRRIGKVRLSK